MSDETRKRIEKEITGLTAKLRWDHLSEAVREAYEARIEELRARLKGE